MINVAIIGQGRSGRDIHGKYFKSEYNTNYKVVAVVEKDEQRRVRAEEEYPGCKSYENYSELYGRDDIDLVVNATYSDEHYSVTKDLLENGFNVLVEKPMARNRYECDNLIRIAKEKNLVLAVFQQSLFGPNFVKTIEVIKSGVLGEVMQVEVKANNFARRWDWQTLQSRMAGNVYNTGPHPIGHALGFLDYDDNARVEFSRLGRALNSGDAEDYAKIILTAPGKPVVDIEISSNDAYCPYAFKVIGSKGTFTCTAKDYKLKYIVDGENPEKPIIFESLKNAEGYPIYCSENLIAHEEEGKIENEVFTIGNIKFYKMLYETLTNGTPLIIKPEYAAKIISVIEMVHANNPMPVIY